MSSTFLSVFLSNCGQAGNPFDQTFLPPSMASFSTFFVALVAICISPVLAFSQRNIRQRRLNYSTKRTICQRKMSMNPGGYSFIGSLTENAGAPRKRPASTRAFHLSSASLSLRL